MEDEEGSCTAFFFFFPLGRYREGVLKGKLISCVCWYFHFKQIAKTFLYVFRTNHKVSFFNWCHIVVILEKVIGKTVIKDNNDNQVLSADYCTMKAIDMKCFSSEKCNQWTVLYYYAKSRYSLGEAQLCSYY